MNIPKMTTYELARDRDSEQARANLMAELDAWDKFAAEGTPEGDVSHKADEPRPCGRDAKRIKGCHLFCVEVFTKFAQAINLYKDSAYRNLASVALKLAGKISKI